MNLNNKNIITSFNHVNKPIFNRNMNYYICSMGGCGSTVLYNYLSLFGNVYHIHDRYPPNKLSYIGNENSLEDIYSEWFNNIEIPEDKLKYYKVIFLYRHPIPTIFSRFAQAKGPNINHLKHIKCDNNGNISIFDVIRFQKDLYKMEEFFDNYINYPSEKNYPIYAVKYESFWENISLFNKLIGIPDKKELYPIRQERPKKMSFIPQLSNIYKRLIYKMNKKPFIEIIPPILNKSIEKKEEIENEC